MDGVEFGLDYGLAAAICGGLLTLGLLTARATTLPAMLARHAWIARLHDRGAGVPYGIALAAAGLLDIRIHRSGLRRSSDRFLLVASVIRSVVFF